MVLYLVLGQFIFTSGHSWMFFSLTVKNLRRGTDSTNTRVSKAWYMSLILYHKPRLWSTEQIECLEWKAHVWHCSLLRFDLTFTTLLLKIFTTQTTKETVKGNDRISQYFLISNPTSWCCCSAPELIGVPAEDVHLLTETLYSIFTPSVKWAKDIKLYRRSGSL